MVTEKQLHQILLAFLKGSDRYLFVEEIEKEDYVVRLGNDINEYENMVFDKETIDVPNAIKDLEYVIENFEFVFTKREKEKPNV